MWSVRKAFFSLDDRHEKVGFRPSQKIKDSLLVVHQANFARSNIWI